MPTRLLRRIKLDLLLAADWARAALQPFRRFHLVRRFDRLWLLDAHSLVDRSVLAKAPFNRAQIARLAGLAHDLSQRHDTVTFVDVGAYFGLYAVEMERTHLFGRIVAIEPDRTNRAQLITELLLNGLLYAVETLPLAISDRTGIVYVERSEMHPDGNRGGVGIVEPAKHPASDAVESARLDQLFPGTDGAYVLKIDVEGHELKVVRGALGLLARNDCVLQIECDDPRRCATLSALLEPLGYRQVGAVKTDRYFVKAPLTR